MLKIGDKVIVTNDVDGNNTKLKTGIIVDKHKSIGWFLIKFGKNLNYHHGGQGQTVSGEDHISSCWFVPPKYIKLINKEIKEYGIVKFCKNL